MHSLPLILRLKGFLTVWGNVASRKQPYISDTLKLWQVTSVWQVRSQSAQMKIRLCHHCDEWWPNDLHRAYLDLTGGKLGSVGSARLGSPGSLWFLTKLGVTCHAVNVMIYYLHYLISDKTLWYNF